MGRCPQLFLNMQRYLTVRNSCIFCKFDLTRYFPHRVHVDDRRVAGRRVYGLGHRRTVSLEDADIAEVGRRQGKRVLGVGLLRVVLALVVRGDLEPVVVDGRFPARVDGGRGRQVLFRLQELSLTLRSCEIKSLRHLKITFGISFISGNNPPKTASCSLTSFDHEDSAEYGED